MLHIGKFINSISIAHFVILFRSAKQVAAEGIRNYLLSPLPTTPYHGEAKWLPESPHKDDACLTTFNECFSTLSTLLPSSNEFITLSSRLQSTWDETPRKEQKQCIKIGKAACEMVCNVIAPGAKDELFKSIVTTHKEEEYHISQELHSLIWAYQNAPTKSLKTQILSIYVDWHPVKTLLKMHEKYERITELQVRKAKEHARNTGPGIPAKTSKKHRVRIDMEKVDHFLDFINRPYFYQDVAFGMRKLELDSGERLSMPNVVRTVTRATMIEQYLSFCKEEEEVEPLNRSTLFRILEVRKSSQRKSLQGLDNTAADGASAFETLETIIDQLEKFGASTQWAKSTKKALKDSKRYLKTQYKVHCRERSSCADHCYIFSLCDQKDEDFQTFCHGDHNTICEQCEQLKHAFHEIEHKCQETVQSNVETRDDLLYDIKNSKTAIEDWKAHILRSENQDRAKQDYIKRVNATTIVILIDWAMKFT